jgi:hypothetical protein
VREVVQWHFDPATGCPFWLDYAKNLSWDPREEVRSYKDLSRFGFFQDEWLRGGPVRRWVPKGLAHRPVYTFETGGSTGVPKSRINIDDFRIDYEAFSDTLPGCRSDQQVRDVCGSQSSTSPSIEAESVSWLTSIRAGSSSSSKWVNQRWLNSTSSTSSSRD